MLPLSPGLRERDRDTPHQSAMHTVLNLRRSCSQIAGVAHPGHTWQFLRTQTSALAQSTQQHSQLCSGCSSPSMPRDSLHAYGQLCAVLTASTATAFNPTPANTGSAAPGNPFIHTTQGLLAAALCRPCQLSPPSTLVLSKGAQTATANLQRGTRTNPRSPGTAPHSCTFWDQNTSSPTLPHKCSLICSHCRNAPQGRSSTCILWTNFPVCHPSSAASSRT